MIARAETPNPEGLGEDERRRGSANIATLLTMAMERRIARWNPEAGARTITADLFVNEGSFDITFRGLPPDFVTKLKQEGMDGLDLRLAVSTDLHRIFRDHGIHIGVDADMLDVTAGSGDSLAVTFSLPSKAYYASRMAAVEFLQWHKNDSLDEIKQATDIPDSVPKHGSRQKPAEPEQKQFVDYVIRKAAGMMLR